MASPPYEVCIQPLCAIEALIDEELSPSDRAVHVEALIAHHLQFASENNRRCAD